MTWPILIANTTLAGRTGTEIVTRDLALGLTRRGHRAMVLTSATGPLAEELGSAGVAVVTSVGDVPQAPSIVHGHHLVETVDALTRFPDARGIFVVHDRTASHSIPPVLNRIHRYVAVDAYCLERLQADWRIPPSFTRIIPNAVDLTRFAPRGPLPEKPVRALIFSHTAGPGTHVELVTEVCRQFGIQVDVRGAASGRVADRPEQILGQYDLVFARARCALEALATGVAVILCDAHAMGPMVTRAALGELREWNLGVRVLRDPMTADVLAREIRRYDPLDAAAVSRDVRRDASLEAALDRYEALYREVLAEPPRADGGHPARVVLTALTERVAALERDLAAYRQPERMDALSDGDVAQVRITLEAAEGRMRAGSTGVVRLRLENGLTDRPLGTWPPHPVAWSYRWRTIESPEFLPREGARTPLWQPVPAGGHRRGWVRVAVPDAPGRYVLRLTLVQELVRWLDQATTPVCVDVEVTVVER